MPGEQSVHSDEASDFRKILEKTSPNSTYSVRSELLSDTDSHKGYRTKTHRTSSHRRHRSRKHKEREIDATTDVTLLQARQLTRLLAREELEAIGLRKAISQAAERLEQESRRATEAETRAREAEARVLALKAAKHAANADALREQETLKAYQAQLEVARNEILRAQKELDTMAAEKERAEEEAAKERSRARAIAKEIEIERARELGRQEGKTEGYRQGRKEGWKLGTRQGVKTAYREMNNDAASFDSRSSFSPPFTQSGQPRPVSPSPRSPAMGSVAVPEGSIPMPTPNVDSDPPRRSTSTRTVHSQASHKRSGSMNSRIRVNSDPKPPSPNGLTNPALTHNAKRAESISRPASARLSRPTSRDRTSSIPAQNRLSTPRHSPLPVGYIPLAENGHIVLPPPNQLEHPPPSPHTPMISLPALVNEAQPSLRPPSPMVNTAPTITVQEPTPPEPPMMMPEPHPAPPPSGAMENGNQSIIREHGSSPPLPPLPPAELERTNKGKQRQRMVPPRAGSSLHAPGRSSPSDTSTEFSQFEIVEQPERVRVVGMGRGNVSQLSIIMEGGSTVAESPELERGPTPQFRNIPPARDIPSRGPPAGQGILDDPREYAEFSETPLSPPELAHRRIVADQLRQSPSLENRNGTRSVRDDISIKSTTTRESAPRRRPNTKMPARLAPSRDVLVLEKQAEMYDAFGTERTFPTFDSRSSPEEVAVATRTPEPNRGPRSSGGSNRPISLGTVVPEITIQPPSRPSSKGSKLSRISHHNHMTPDQMPVTFPAPATPSRRHSIQGSPLSPSRIPLPPTSGNMPVNLGTPHPEDMGLPPGFVPTQGPPLTPSRIPLPLTSGQIPMGLKSPNPNEFGLPPGFVPTHGPPEVLAAFSSTKTPGTNAAGLPSRTPRLNINALSPVGGPPRFPGLTPSAVPLPLSSATVARGLPDNLSSAPWTGKSSHRDLPPHGGGPQNGGGGGAAPPSPSFRYPMTPARVPLPPDSFAGSPYGSMAQTPRGGGGLGLAPGPPPMSAGLGRPMALYSGEGGAKQKVSTTSLASSYKKFDPSTYVDPAFLASSSATALPEPTAAENHGVVKSVSRASSLRSAITNKPKVKSVYAPSVETTTDEDDVKS